MKRCQGDLRCIKAGKQWKHAKPGLETQNYIHAQVKLQEKIFET